MERGLGGRDWLNILWNCFSTFIFSCYTFFQVDFTIPGLTCPETSIAFDTDFEWREKSCTWAGGWTHITSNYTKPMEFRPKCYTQWFKMPDHLRKWFLSSEWWKQVNCAYFLSEKVSFCFKKLSKATKAKKANEGQQRPAKSKTSNFFVIITIQCKIINKCEYDTKKKCF